jgi:hypothetical protein
MDSDLALKKEVHSDIISSSDDKCSNIYVVDELKKPIFARFCGENGENATKNGSRILQKILHCHYCRFNTSNKHNFEKHQSTKKHLNNLGKSQLNLVDGLDEIGSSPSNQINQIQDGVELYCSCCKVGFISNKDLERHLSTKKHLNKVGNVHISNNFNCDVCMVSFSKSYLLNKHVLSKIHKAKISSELKEYDETPNAISIINNEVNTTDAKPYVEIINKLLSENKEMRNFFVEQNQEMLKIIHERSCMPNTNTMTNNFNMNNNTIHGNINNNKFNINVFLNEQCKDAINLPEFIENIEVSHNDLENNGLLGFVDGISKIFLDNLKQLSVYERPIHCTDIKRETLYVKYDNKWTKDESVDKLNGAIRDVSYKSIGVLNEWKESNPEYKDINSEFSDKCMVMTKNTLAGYDRDAYYSKVIRIISKETSIDKNEK